MIQFLIGLLLVSTGFLGVLGCIAYWIRVWSDWCASKPEKIWNTLLSIPFLISFVLLITIGIKLF